MNPNPSNKTPEDKFMDAYEVHNEAIFRFVYFKLGDRARAVDITQDVFTKAWEYIAKGNSVRSLKALLYRIAGNAVIDEYRRKKTASLDGLIESGLEFEGNEEHVRIVEKDDGQAVVTLLATLEPAHQDVLMLRYIEDLSIPEIAKRLGISENTVSVRIHRAQSILRDKYKDNPKYGTI